MDIVIVPTGEAILKVKYVLDSNKIFSTKQKKMEVIIKSRGTKCKRKEGILGNQKKNNKIK
jgi:hypothetical protein